MKIAVNVGQLSGQGKSTLAQNKKYSNCDESTCDNFWNVQTTKKRNTRRIT